LRSLTPVAKGLAVEVELEGEAVEIDRRLVGVLHAQLHCEAHLHALARQGFEPDHVDAHRLALDQAGAAGEQHRCEHGEQAAGEGRGRRADSKGHGADSGQGRALCGHGGRV
jgi:hypothetical protein